MNPVAALRDDDLPRTASAEPDAIVINAACHVLLLLADRVQLREIEALLRKRLPRLQVTHATSLGDAMRSVPGPALAVLDIDLCDALEQEFAAHLLRVDPDTVVLVVSDEPLPPDWPAQARLLHAARADLIGTVERALSHPLPARWQAGLDVGRA